MKGIEKPKNAPAPPERNQHPAYNARSVSDVMFLAVRIRIIWRFLQVLRTLFSFQVAKHGFFVLWILKESKNTAPSEGVTIWYQYKT